MGPPRLVGSVGSEQNFLKKPRERSVKPAREYMLRGEPPKLTPDNWRLIRRTTLNSQMATSLKAIETAAVAKANKQ